MGGGGSQTIEQRFNMSAMNKSIYEQITKNQSRASASQATVQNLKVVMRNIKGCSSKFGQTINAEAISSSELTAETTTAIKNAVTNDMQASVSAQIEKATQMGNLQFGDKQNISQDVQLAITNIVENSITTENLNEAIAEQVSIQGGELIIDGYDCREGGDISWDQDVTAKLSASAVTKALTSAIADNTVLNELAAAASGGASSENTGLAGLLEAFTGPMRYAIIAAICCCCLLVILLIVIGLSPAGQSATANLGRAGASRISNGRSF